MEVSTPRLVLREFVEDDWRVLHAIESRSEVVLYLPFDERTEDNAREYVQGILVSARELPRMRFDFAITLDGVMIGRTGMGRKDGEPRVAMLWFVIDPRHGGKGYVTEAATALLRFAFEEVKLHRVYGECDPRNLASARVMDKLGMRLEAEHIEDIWIKGEWCGTQVFAMLAREWAAR